ncbi:chromosome partition protein Smc-like isoform X2 [Ptychodera flava]|uniref:chromosome partition protein Smc-like isoform X2 n=1 Tax=Ptychodera flava TaxID=63121 RepID=UPI00396AAD49
MADYMEQYHTHPDGMRGASRQAQNAMMQKQVTAFEKLVKHGISKFSKEKLHRMLTEITPRDVKLMSFSELREVIEKATNKPGLAESDAAAITKYFNAFFNDIEYLKKMKSHYDERIYSVLHEFFYDPVVEDILSSPAGQHKSSRQTKRKDNILKRLNRYAIGDRALSGPAFEELLEDCDNLSRIMSDLRDLNEQWQMLLDDDEIDGNIFDDESAHELLSFDDYKHFEHIFMFVPDVLTKSYNAIELAKLWWVTAEKIHNALYQGQSPHRVNNDDVTADDVGKGDEVRDSRDDEEVDDRDSTSGIEADDEDDMSSIVHSSDAERIDDMIDELEERLRVLTKRIKLHERELRVQQEDLAHLAHRESRVSTLAGNLEDVFTTQESVGQQIQELSDQKDAITSKLRKQRRDSTQYRDLQKKLTSVEKNLDELEHSSTYHNFQHRIIASDLDVELEVQPSIIRFAGDIQDKIIKLENCLSDDKTEKRRVEKELVLLKTNSDDSQNRPPDSAESGLSDDTGSRPTSEELERLRPKTSDTVVISKKDDARRRNSPASRTMDKSIGSDEPIDGDLLKPRPKIHHRKTDSGGGEGDRTTQNRTVDAKVETKRKAVNDRGSDTGKKAEKEPQLLTNGDAKHKPKETSQMKKTAPPRMYDQKRDFDPTTKSKNKTVSNASSTSKNNPQRRQSRLPVRS